jgi:hypothetical protein
MTAEDPEIPEPDTKDWTWVLQTPCPECGYRSGASPGEIAEQVRGNVPRWQIVLQRPAVAERPAPAVWSALEYACHVRDVYELFYERLLLMRTQEDPTFRSWDQDAAALEKRYWTADPAIVARELSEAGEQIADAFASVDAAELHRTGRRSNGSLFTIETFGWYFLHDDVHHLFDVAG